MNPAWKRLVSLISVHNSSFDLKRFEVSPDDSLILSFYFSLFFLLDENCVEKAFFNLCTQFFSWRKKNWGQSCSCKSATVARAWSAVAESHLRFWVGVISLTGEDLQHDETQTQIQNLSVTRIVVYVQWKSVIFSVLKLFSYTKEENLANNQSFAKLLSEEDQDWDTQVQYIHITWNNIW